MECDHLSMLGLKLNHVSKRGPRNPQEKSYSYSLWYTVYDFPSMKICSDGAHLFHKHLEMHGPVLLPLVSWCYSTKPSLPTVLTKYSLYWANFIYIYSEQTMGNKVTFWKKMTRLFKILIHVLTGHSTIESAHSLGATEDGFVQYL